MTIRERIISFLQNYPTGIDDDKLAEALGLRARQQANSCCRELEKEGLIIRRSINGKTQNFWASKDHINPDLNKPEIKNNPGKFEQWFWEGNVQAKTVHYLLAQNFEIVSTADTASHQRGIDIVAKKNNNVLWISVKGYPRGTPKTNPSLQASHWFKQAIFDMIEYRERDKSGLLAVALPDFPRYRKMAEKITWLQPVAEFSYIWISEEGKITVENRKPNNLFFS